MLVIPRPVLCKAWRTASLLAAASVALVLASPARGAWLDPALTPQVEQPTARPGTSPAIEDLLREGFRLYDNSQLDLAQQHFERARELSQAQKDLRSEAEAHRGLGLVFDQKAQYPVAQAELEQALKLFEVLSDRRGAARVHRQLGAVARMMGDWKEAREHYNKALAEFDALGELQEKANVLINLLYLPGIAPEQEQKLIQEGLGISRQVGDRRLEGKLLHVWGDHAFVRGDFSAALEKLEQAAACFEEAKARHELARVFTSLGRLHRAHGSYEQALECYRRGLQIQEEIGDRQGVIQSLNAMAVAYSYLGKQKEVLEQYQRALELARQTGSAGIISFILGNLAGAYQEAGDSARAVELLEEALRLAPDSEVVEYRYSGLSQAYYTLGKYPQALEAAEKAVARTRQKQNLEFLPRPLLRRAKAKQKLGKTAEALVDAHEALAALEQLRARLVPADFMKRGFGDHNQELFAFTIELHQELGQPKEGLEAAEQARARAFLDLLAARQLQQKTVEPAGLVALRKLENELKSGGPGRTQFEKGPSYALTLRGGQPDLPSPASTKTFSSEQMVATASRLHSTILSYWVNPDATYIWVVSSDGSVRSVSVEVSAQRLAQLIRETWAGLEASVEPGPEVAGGEGESATVTAKRLRHRPRLRGGDVVVLDESQKEAWRELYRLLIRPVRSLLPAASGSLVTIVPHGPLFLLSFAGLLDEQDRYLVETYRLHYAPAAAVLEFTEKKKEQLAGHPPRYLLIADPTGLPRLAGARQLPPLPGAREEVAAIRRGLPREAVTVLLGGQAQEENVRRLIRDVSIVHFATHGIVRDDQPFDSFLALGANGSAGPDDGRLTAQEIYGLNLQADLVVLSACRSALGKLSGDGMVGFTRAFFYAGTPSILATLWDVADEPTSRLMSNFYRAFDRTHDKSLALRAAQLHLLRALRQGRVKVNTPAGTVVLPEHPVFWASFVLLGEP